MYSVNSNILDHRKMHQMNNYSAGKEDLAAEENLKRNWKQMCVNLLFIKPKYEIQNAFHQTSYLGQGLLREKWRIYLSHAACMD